MTIIAGCSGMGAQQGKSPELMYGGDVFHQPGAGSVAAGTFKTKGLLMHVGVAIGAFRTCPGKDQGGMA
jgi:hypothetical protein